jgi:capsular polysaccharide export protein
MAAYHVGFSPRKARILARFAEEPVLRLPRGGTPGSGDRIYAWGDAEVPACAAAIIRVEDGFLRSVGLGAAFAEPVSWSFDDGGLHHRGDRPTRLERIIRDLPEDPARDARARSLAATVRDAGLTMNNLGDAAWRPPAAADSSRRLLVIGQVCDDAALRAITTPVRSNIALLRAVRESHPDAFILYKRHPDVVAGLREGDDQQALQYANDVVGQAGVDALLGWADEVHVMNSLFGFEALIRGARVTCHAAPFYAGWGLTDDRCPLPRRQVRRSLDQLLAAALILYPRYNDPRTRCTCTPEAALDILIESRHRRATSPHSVLGDAIKLRLGRLFKAFGRAGKAPARPC